MKTHLTTIISIVLVVLMLSCNKNNKTKTILLNEKISVITDSETDSTTTQSIETVYINNNIWNFIIIDRDSLNTYKYENKPFLIFSIDSSFVYVNAGCNIYIGECKIATSNKIKFDNIKLKDEICPINALERQIVYTLEECNSYVINGSKLYLLKNDQLIGELISDKYRDN